MAENLLVAMFCFEVGRLWKLEMMWISINGRKFSVGWNVMIIRWHKIWNMYMEKASTKALKASAKALRSFGESFKKIRFGRGRVAVRVRWKLWKALMKAFTRFYLAFTTLIEALRKLQWKFWTIFELNESLEKSFDENFEKLRWKLWALWAALSSLWAGFEWFESAMESVLRALRALSSLKALK